ncbi:MAG: efflux RND transporter permease subunit, partial [Tetrasphaera sp.]|nr:efflux RND transporter permease subunit [Tetrasphaera sp.]
VEPIEEAVIQVEGVRALTSVSRQGTASCTVELGIDRDVDVAMQDIQTKIAQAQRRLPVDVEITASKSNPEDQPIMWIGLAGPYSRSVLTDYARYVVKERLQRIEGVGEIFMGGYLERNVRVWVDADALAAYHLTVTDVITALQKEHVEQPAGQISGDGHEINVRVMGEAFDLDTLRDVVITRDQLGAPVRVRDVARIEDGFEDERRRARVFGNPVQGLGIKKLRGSNAVAVAKAVREALVEINKELPEGMEAGVNFDSAKFIEESVHDIELELVMAVLLTALVCWMFLGSLSSTVNVIAAIPMSLLGTIAAIYFLGYTLNTFTLLALSLAVGIVVDDAIMVMENIYRHAEQGAHRLEAARKGTAEIAFAALAATVALIAIFIPVVFMEGVIGKYFMQFGVTLSIAVLLSYLEAITLAPARCAQLLRSGRQERSGLGRLVDRAFDALAAGYRWALARALRWPAAVLVVAVGLLVATVMIFQRVPQEMVPSQDQSRLMIRLQTAVSADLEEMDGLMQQVEAAVNGRPDVARAMAIIGGFGGSGVNTGVYFVTLVPKDQRSKSQAQIAGELRRQLNAIPGLRAVVQDLSQQGFTAQRGFPIEVSVRGPDWDTLVAESQRIKQELEESGLAVDVDSDYQLGMPELRVVPDRAQASDVGVAAQDIATTVGALVGGVRIGKYTSKGRRVDVRVKVERSQRTSPEDVARLRVRTASGVLVPLSRVTQQQERPALQSVTRRDRERAITIFANPAPGHSQKEAIDFVLGLRKSMPPGYRIVPGGQSVAFQESMGGLVFAFFLGLGVAYMILASQFNSFLQPITVLTIIPLSLAGALGALYVGGFTLNIFSMIGLLLLAGIVKKNSIILVDYAQVAREQGADARAAMMTAGPTRLRPILMTSVATAMAALPAALGLGQGSETRTPMAVAVIGGLAVSTVLSLFVVPAFYVVADGAKRALGFGRKLGNLGDV